MVARGSTCRIVMKGHHRGKVARGNGGLPRTQGKIPGQLRPECRFQAQVLSRDGHPRVCQDRTRQRHAIIQRFHPPCVRIHGHRAAGCAFLIHIRIIREHVKREMMVSHHELVAGQGIERALELFGL